MKEKNKPGELGFSVVLLLIGLFALIESIRMYMKEPTSSSYGAIPLFLSVMIVVFMIKVIFFEIRKQKKEDEAAEPKHSLNTFVQYIFPKDIVVVFLLMIAYCLMLVFKVGFEISTVVFLVLSMTYLMRGQLVKNVLYTAISLGFILIVFRTIFQVILP